jgi:cytochrome b561
LKTEKYGAVALLFHWSTALLVVGLAALGLYMVTLPDVGFSTRKITLVLYHKEFGVLAFVLLAARFSWRITQYSRGWLKTCRIGRKCTNSLKHRALHLQRRYLADLK